MYSVNYNTEPPIDVLGGKSGERGDSRFYGHSGKIKLCSIVSHAALTTSGGKSTARIVARWTSPVNPAFMVLKAWKRKGTPLLRCVLVLARFRTLSLWSGGIGIGMPLATFFFRDYIPGAVDEFKAAIRLNPEQGRLFPSASSSSGTT